MWLMTELRIKYHIYSMLNHHELILLPLLREVLIKVYKEAVDFIPLLENQGCN